MIRRLVLHREQWEHLLELSPAALEAQLWRFAKRLGLEECGLLFIYGPDEGLVWRAPAGVLEDEEVDAFVETTAQRAAGLDSERAVVDAERARLGLISELDAGCEPLRRGHFDPVPTREALRALGRRAAELTTANESACDALRILRGLAPSNPWHDVSDTQHET